MPGAQQRQIAASVGQRHRQRQPRHRGRLRHRHHTRHLSQPVAQGPQSGQCGLHPKPFRPDPTLSVGCPDAHLMLRNDRSIDPDPHQPRRVTTTLNKHEGSPFASTKSTPHHRPVTTGVLTNTGGPSSHPRKLPPIASRHQPREQSPTPALVGDPVHAQASHRVAELTSATNSLQPGLQARRQVPKLTISFTSPNTHPRTATPEDPSQAIVASTPTVTETPSKRYKPSWRPFSPGWGQGKA